METGRTSGREEQVEKFEFQRDMKCCLEIYSGKTSNKWVGGVLKLSPTSEQRVWYSQILYTASDTTYVTTFSLFAK